MSNDFPEYYRVTLETCNSEGRAVTSRDSVVSETEPINRSPIVRRAPDAYNMAHAFLAALDAHRSEFGRSAGLLLAFAMAMQDNGEEAIETGLLSDLMTEPQRQAVIKAWNEFQAAAGRLLIAAADMDGDDWRGDIESLCG